MKMSLKKLPALLQEAGLKNPKVDKFEDRLKIQKLVYLFEYMGIHLDYNFSLHLRGPYCPRLADDYFGEAKKSIENQESDYTPTKQEMQKIEKLKETLGVAPSVLELASTYIYLTTEKGYSPEKAYLKIKEIKKYYSDSEISYAITKAKELYQPSNEELAEIKKKAAPWENADSNDF